MYLQCRGPACADSKAGSCHTEKTHIRGGSNAAGQRNRPGQKPGIYPEPQPGAQPAVMDTGVQHTVWRAEQNDPVQGQKCKAPRQCQRRPVYLSGADGSGYPSIQRAPGTCGCRPETACGAGQKHRPEVQRQLRRNLCDARGTDTQSGRQNNEPAGTHKENEQI